jgi:hypothetical protein
VEESSTIAQVKTVIVSYFTEQMVRLGRDKAGDITDYTIR